MKSQLYADYCEGHYYYDAINRPLPEDISNFFSEALNLLRTKRYHIPDELVAYTPKHLHLNIVRTLDVLSNFISIGVFSGDAGDFDEKKILFAAFMECMVFDEVGRELIVQKVGADNFKEDIYTGVNFLAEGIKFHSGKKILSGLKPSHIYAFYALFQLANCVSVLRRCYISAVDFERSESRLDSMEKVMGSLDFYMEAVAAANMAYVDVAIEKIDIQEAYVQEHFIRPRQMAGAKSPYEHFYKTVLPWAADIWQSEVDAERPTTPTEMAKLLIEKYKNKHRNACPEDLTGFKNKYLAPEYKIRFPNNSLKGRPPKKI